MKKTEKGSAGIKKKISGSLKFLRKRGVLILLLLLMTVGPVFSAAAGSKQASAAGEENMLSAMGSILSPVKLYLAGEEIQPVRTLTEEELAEALASLNEFNVNVLKDPRLASILDEIIWGLVDNEDFTGAIQDRKEFFADIVRDERLVSVLGDVIADYLRDPKLAQDIEYFFSVIVDLVADPELQHFIMETVALLLENPKLEATINQLLTAAVDMGYGSFIEAAVGMITDPGIPGVLQEVTAVLLESLPELINMVDDERVLAVAESMVEIIMEYGNDTAINLLEDQRLRTALADMLVLSVENVPAGAIASDLTELALRKAGESLSDGTLDQVLSDFVNELFLGVVDYIDVPGVGLVALPVLLMEISSPPAVTTRYSALTATHKNNLRTQINKWYLYNFANNNLLDAAVVIKDYGADTQLWIDFHNALNYIKTQSANQASANTPEERSASCSEAFGQRPGIASAVAEVPADLMRDAFFTWLMFGIPEANVSGAAGWVTDMGKLLTPERAEDLGAAMGSATRAVIDDFMVEHNDDIALAFRNAVLDLPWDELAQGLRDEENIELSGQILLNRIMANMPLSELADYIGEQLEGVQLDVITAELFSEIPFEEAGIMLGYDRRIIDKLHDSIPGFSLKEVANLVRNDRRIISALADTVATFPVNTLSGFLQDPQRAEYIGHTLAGIVLNLAADFVEDERMADFINDVIINIIGSFEDSPGTMVLGFLSAFLDNDDFAHYWVTALPVQKGVTEEAADMYKQAVPRFFTYFIWNWRFM